MRLPCHRAWYPAKLRPRASTVAAAISSARASCPRDSARVWACAASSGAWRRAVVASSRKSVASSRIRMSRSSRSTPRGKLVRRLVSTTCPPVRRPSRRWAAAKAGSASMLSRIRNQVGLVLSQCSAASTLTDLAAACAGRRRGPTQGGEAGSGRLCPVSRSRAGSGRNIRRDAPRRILPRPLVLPTPPSPCTARPAIAAVPPSGRVRLVRRRRMNVSRPLNRGPRLG